MSVKPFLPNEILKLITPIQPRQTKNNAIYTPSLNEIVPVGIPYKITWKPDVPGLVNIYLLSGPTQNLKVLSAIAEGIQNTGSFLWTPDTGLEDDKTHYGLNLTMPGIPGEFQYSTQFGISNTKKGGAGTGSGTGTGTSGGASTTSNAFGTSTSVMATVSTGTATSVVATMEVTVTTSSVSVATNSVAVTGATYSNGTVTGKTTASLPSTGSVKANGTTSAGGVKPSSGADGMDAGGLGAVVMAFGAALMI